ncbi:hypothetical protein LX87_04115 [Larkinella arboricola]|uniref:Uncharacterized protein n=1 Tax=Larkinella arboricola TaxID=643671 RepID=A0A327WQP2_LARAB|nr:hypothetical protein [Larkinella arboricola]RAJ94230.1 hypothetical protein LX87_04115 [Larkinella arboricola]
MLNITIRAGVYKGELVSTITDKSFLIRYRSNCNPQLRGLELLAINQRIRELHRLTRP